MEQLNQLADACVSIEISVNKHKSLGISISKYVNDPDLEKRDTFKEIVEKDSVVKIEAYSKEYNCLLTIYDHDLNSAIKQVTNILL